MKDKTLYIKHPQPKIATINFMPCKICFGVPFKTGFVAYLPYKRVNTMTLEYIVA